MIRINVMILPEKIPVFQYLIVREKDQFNEFFLLVNSDNI